METISLNYFKNLNKKTMYTTDLTKLLDLFDYPKWNTTSSNHSSFVADYDVSQLEDGQQQLTLNVLGHDAKNIKLDVTDDKIKIKAKKEEGSSPLVKEIDVTFTVSKDYDGTKTKAKFSNGLLILTIDKKEERKSKSISITVD
jgi:HSP20 family molecular chaperone IbpA